MIMGNHNIISYKWDSVDVSLVIAWSSNICKDHAW